MIEDPTAENALIAQGWRPFEACEKKRATWEFLFADGAVCTGVMHEFWCGSDCPCYNLDKGPDEFMNCYPECWGVLTEGNMLQADPTHFRPCP